MGAFINLIISLIMGATFGNDMDHAKTAQFEPLETSPGIFQILEDRQEILQT